jgi:hypothetical protein
MKTMLLERINLQVQTQLTSSVILIPGYNMDNLSLQSRARAGRKRTSKMTKWYTAIRMSEEVLARHYCSESSSGVDHLSGEVLSNPRQI